MINPNHFSTSVVVPTLRKLAAFDERMYSRNAVALLMGTVAQESDMGFFLHQIGGGPGNGVYSIEPNTNHSLFRHYLIREDKWPLKKIILDMVPSSAILDENDGAVHYTMVHPDQLLTNLEYATAMARLLYWTKPDPIPAEDDILALGNYWDKHYNGNPNVGTAEEFKLSFEKWLRKWAQ